MHVGLRRPGEATLVEVAQCRHLLRTAKRRIAQDAPETEIAELRARPQRRILGVCRDTDVVVRVIGEQRARGGVGVAGRALRLALVQSHSRPLIRRQRRAPREVGVVFRRELTHRRRILERRNRTTDRVVRGEHAGAAGRRQRNARSLPFAQPIRVIREPDCLQHVVQDRRCELGVRAVGNAVDDAGSVRERLLRGIQEWQQRLLRRRAAQPPPGRAPVPEVAAYPARIRRVVVQHRARGRVRSARRFAVAEARGHGAGHHGTARVDVRTRRRESPRGGVAGGARLIAFEGEVSVLEDSASQGGLAGQSGRSPVAPLTGQRTYPGRPGRRDHEGAERNKTKRAPRDGGPVAR